MALTSTSFKLTIGILFLFLLVISCALWSFGMDTYPFVKVCTRLVGLNLILTLKVRRILGQHHLQMFQQPDIPRPWQRNR
jgi:hypothetical protein